MKFKSIFKKIIKSFIIFWITIFVFQVNTLIVKAIFMNNYQTGLVIEELRLKIPADYREVWLQAEKTVWEPWLSLKEGFMGRQIFWDKEKEEALILVTWENKELWKSISIQEVNEIQEQFEENVKRSLKVSENPFKLIYEGELNKQV